VEFELLGTTKALHAPVASIVYKPLPGDTYAYGGARQCIFKNGLLWLTEWACDIATTSVSALTLHSQGQKSWRH